jgi:hypothetical protein
MTCDEGLVLEMHTMTNAPYAYFQLSAIHTVIWMSPHRCTANLSTLEPESALVGSGAYMMLRSRCKFRSPGRTNTSRYDKIDGGRGDLIQL